MRGFTAESARRQGELERAVLAGLDPERIRGHLRELTREPHPAGSDANERVAAYIASVFEDAGLPVEYEDAEMLIAEPVESRVELLRPRHHLARSREDGVEPDEDSRRPDVSPIWLAYSASGSVEARLVYANYGRPDDLARLRELGIDPEGAVLLVRSFHGYRGSKVYAAEQSGAAGIVFFVDPGDERRGDAPVYPDGLWPPSDRGERGSAAYDFFSPGDPREASTWDTAEGRNGDSRVLPGILATGIAQGDATVLLRELGGEAAPDDWQGGFPHDYRLGSPETVVRLTVEQRRVAKSIRNVVARVDGASRPDESVVLSNHHDAWVYGAVDPCSATATMLDVARVLGRAVREGHRPARSIVLCNWDGEEFTLAGSTIWAMRHQESLLKGGIACLNVDSAIMGGEPSFWAGGAPSLRPFLVDVAAAVPDPGGTGSIADLWSGYRPAFSSETFKTRYHAARSPELGPRGLESGGPYFHYLGLGSDYAAFFHHIGMPSLDFFFDGTNAVYGSAYDTFTWVDTYGDPGYRYHAAIGQLWAIAAWRLADADVLPFAPGETATAIHEAAGQLAGLASVGHGRQELLELGERSKAWLEDASAWETTLADLARDGAVEAARCVEASRAILAGEHAFTSREGLPGRPWFRNLLFGPRFDYSPSTLPAVREAAQEGDGDAAAGHAHDLVGRIDAAAGHMQRAVGVLTASPAA